MVSNNQCLPVSEILKSKSETDDEPKKKSREDWRKAKELEEARKAGTAPAAVDEEGKDINPHIPQYISSAPWYYGKTGPTLKHQRPQEEKQKEYSGIDEWYARGVDRSKVVIKYRKGACENCGALTHKKKECMERPRKVGAKFSGANIAPDEYIQKNLSLSFDGKRDRWSGYDPSEHKTVIEEFQKVEEAKRHLKAEKLNAEESEDEEKDEDKYVDEVDMPGTKVDSKHIIVFSYHGENFVRFSGDTQNHAKAQLFAWEAYEKGVDVHLLAEPTKLELLKKEYEKKKEQIKTKIQSNVLERYGGEEHLEEPPRSLLLAQTEDYIEYSRSGKIIKGAEKEVIKSKYEEDVYINNHTSVWGSYWRGGQWGYKCCHSFIKNSFCLGEAGRNSEIVKPHELPESRGDVNEDIPDDKKGNSDRDESSSSSSDEKSKKKKQKKEKKKLKKMKKKLRQEKHITNKMEETEEIMDERKRPYNSMYEVKKPTEEEMEQYFKKRKRDEDPMNQFL
nr:pre-mRNA-splicing factor Slu7-like [Leptinotarsa decemlineata]